MIPEEILRQYQPRLVQLARDEMLFQQGERAAHFHVVKSGRIKMATWNDQGREFVQGYFTEGESFGEPPLFNNLPYPASAIAVVPSQVWKLPYDRFIELLRQNFDVHIKLTQVLSGRLIYKSMMLTEIAVEEAEHRLATLIEYFHRTDPTAPETGGAWKVPFTRQQLADMTGLRVETVIRSIKGMEGKGALRIDDGKIIWTKPRTYRTE
ncbi:MAG: Crp/Fnr family transcriptional regulator [Chlorobi bacterium CHB2]|nr:Crp/Fnr family transcriptional regulator [Chlorobi bacterium CHB2]